MKTSKRIEAPALRPCESALVFLPTKIYVQKVVVLFFTLNFLYIYTDKLRRRRKIRSSLVFDYGVDEDIEDDAVNTLCAG